MSDRIAVINKGQIEQLGDASQIYHRPRTTFVANFIGQANILEGKIVSNGSSRATVTLNDQIKLSVEADNLSPTATTALVSIRPEKIQLRKEKPGEENCFEAPSIQGPAPLSIVAIDPGEHLAGIPLRQSDRRVAGRYRRKRPTICKPRSPPRSPRYTRRAPQTAYSQRTRPAPASHAHRDASYLRSRRQHKPPQSLTPTFPPPPSNSPNLPRNASPSSCPCSRKRPSLSS